MIDDWYYRSSKPSRNDLVFFRVRDGVTVKRVIAVGGDRIEGKDQQVFLNGEILDEPFIQHIYGTGRAPEQDNFGPVQVPVGKYFVIGDNRDLSLDSRFAEFGLVEGDKIMGRPLYSYAFFAKGRQWKDLK